MASDAPCTVDSQNSTKSETDASIQDDSDEQQRINPFDTCLLDVLHRPAFTPSVFARVVSPSNSGSTGSPVCRPSTSRGNPRRRRRFRWSIDHIAALNPANIDDGEVALQESSQRYDEETEERLQAAIDCFFSQPLIAPSPWKSTDVASSNHVCPVEQSPATPEDHKNGDNDLESVSPRDIAKTPTDDINSSVYLLPSSPESVDESPFLPFTTTPKRWNLERSSFGMQRLPSPDISPIKQLALACDDNDNSS